MLGRRRPLRTPARRGGRSRPQGRPWRRRIALGALGGFVLLVISFAVAYALVHIPEPGEVAAAQAVSVRDANGDRLGRLHAGANRVSIPLEQMPEHLRDAVVAIEDRTFYSNPGIAPVSIVRAMLANLRAGRTVQGGSTITQQYVKNAFVGAERSLFRKAKEAVLAIKLDRTWTKDEILEAYLNTIYFGRGTYGVEAASRTYFGHKASKLTLTESALLAGIIRAPETYDPARAPDEARARRDLVIEQMQAQGMLRPEQAERAMRARVRVRPRAIGGIAAHFLEDVRATLEQEIGARALYAGGVTVEVTLDRDMQRAAEAAVRGVYDRRSDPQVSLVAIEPETGAVRAMVGSRDFSRVQFNLATQARRQPGSTFKAAVLAAALEADIDTTRVFRAPATITIDTDSGPWRVSNYDRADRGRLTVSRATELSVNTVYAQLIARVGPDAVAELAARAGILSDLDPVHSLALGTSGVTTLELTSLYATFAARGLVTTPTMIERVTDADGRVLYEPAPVEAVRALPAEIADHVNRVLQGVMTRGTGTSAQIGRPAAGKTGTTENHRDALFAGYTPDLATVVWNGYLKGKDLRGVRGIDVTGGSFPAAIWRAFMSEALAGVPPTPFTVPAEPERPSPSPSPSKTGRPPAPVPSPTQTPTREPSPSPSPSESPSPAPTQSPEPSPSPSET